MLQRFLNLFVLKISSFITVNARTDIRRSPICHFESLKQIKIFSEKYNDIYHTTVRNVFSFYSS